jgi:hypothetical protein
VEAALTNSKQREEGHEELVKKSLPLISNGFEENLYTHVQTAAYLPQNSTSESGSEYRQNQGFDSRRNSSNSSPRPNERWISEPIRRHDSSPDNSR